MEDKVSLPGFFLGAIFSRLSPCQTVLIECLIYGDPQELISSGGTERKRAIDDRLT